MIQDMVQSLKTPADSTAIVAAVLSFFKLIPWAEIAAFLSAVYLLVRLYYVIKNKGKGG